MEATIVLIGTELLSGLTVDTNSIFIAEKLGEIGVEVASKEVVRDNIDEIVDAIKRNRELGRLVILSGGLGPTIDDITKEGISRYLGVPLIVYDGELEKLKDKFRVRNLKFIEENIKEVERPKGSIAFENKVGMAEGIFIDEIAAFPGVPRELYDILPRFIEFYKKEKNLVGSLEIVDLNTIEIPESYLDKELKDLFIYEGIHYEFLAKDHGVVVRLQYHEKYKDKADEIIEKIYERFGKNIFSRGSKKLNEIVLEKLIEKNLTMSVGESCTGGLLASSIIDLDGASKVFYEGVVSYDNNSKIKRLGVKEETLDRYGAVSEEVASEMLDGLSGNLRISTTGVAGPSGGTKEKPVGTVYIGVEVFGNRKIMRYNFKGSRKRVRERTVLSALYKASQLLDKEEV